MKGKDTRGYPNRGYKPTLMIWEGQFITAKAPWTWWHVGYICWFSPLSKYSFSTVTLIFASHEELTFWFDNLELDLLQVPVLDGGMYLHVPRLVEVVTESKPMMMDINIIYSFF